MSRRIQFKVRGTVQGVNFRYYTAKKADSLGVTGFVQNEKDGSVTGEAQGSDDALKDFLKIIKEGPPLAEVSEVEQSDVEKKEGESGFQQRRGGFWG